MSREQKDLRQLGSTIDQAQDQFLSHQNYLGDVRRRLLAKPEHRKKPLRWLRAIQIATLAGAAVTAAFLLWPRAPLTFMIGDNWEVGQVGQWISPSGSEPLAMHFSDGSLIKILPQGSVRIDEIDRRGAIVSVKQGTADVFVMPRKKAKWRFDVGPFKVKVLGTQFNIGWDIDRAVFNLSMKKGTVQVQGPIIGERLFKAGDAIEVRVDEKRFELQNPARPTEPRAKPPATEDNTNQVVPVTSQPIKIKKPSKALKQPGKDQNFTELSELAAEGKYSEAVAAAEKIGWNLVIEKSSAQELQDIADAARLAHKTLLAEQAYRTVRNRFPKTKAAGEGAFALGKIAFDEQKNYTSAANWFGLYLKESPQGALIQDAAGRKMEAEQKIGQVDAAKKTAKQYLELFPKGPHAPLARTVLAK